MITRDSHIEGIDWEQGEMLLVDKPKDWTSFDVVARLRSIINTTKIGHAGTLDPKATGLLLIATGKMTKGLESYSGLEKEYSGIMELGATTVSFDSETQPIEKKDSSFVSSELISNVFQSFLGTQQQIPPMYSAVKVNGKRLYKHARKGRDLAREPRIIVIEQFTMTEFNPPMVSFTVVCSKGTYIRSLVNDVGTKLGCGAYVKELRRTRIGPYHVGDALSIEDLYRLKALPEPAALST